MADLPGRAVPGGSTLSSGAGGQGGSFTATGDGGRGLGGNGGLMRGNDGTGGTGPVTDGGIVTDGMAAARGIAAASEYHWLVGN